DFTEWTAGYRVQRRLRQFVEEAQPKLIHLIPGYRKSGPISNVPSYVYRIHSFERVSFAIGFSPGEESRASVINTIALNEELPQNQKRLAAETALAHPSGDCDYLWWGDWPCRTRLA